MTFGQIANKLSVCRSYVCKLEKGKRDPSARIMLRLAKLLGCQAEELFFYE
jgi:DNA-binding XRE family transcriptional regulator